MTRVTDVPGWPDSADQRGSVAESALAGRLLKLAPGHPSWVPPDGHRRPADPGADRAEMARWNTALPQLRAAWQRHLEKWPRPARPAGGADDVAAPAGGGLDADAVRRLGAAVDTIKTAADRISGTLRAIEAEDPGRRLAGLAHCLKGPGRLLAKASKFMEQMPGISAADAVDLVPDAVRFTFEYRQSAYAGGVRADLGRLMDSGFEPVKLRNYWAGSEYKGINSQWRDPGTGQRFEVQFHTAASLAAKEFTHDAYRRLRSGTPDDTSRGELTDLHAFQREVDAVVPVPPGAAQIPDYR